MQHLREQLEIVWIDFAGRVFLEEELLGEDAHGADLGEQARQDLAELVGDVRVEGAAVVLERGVDAALTLLHTGALHQLHHVCRDTPRAVRAQLRPHQLCIMPRTA